MEGRPLAIHRIGLIASQRQTLQVRTQRDTCKPREARVNSDSCPPIPRYREIAGAITRDADEVDPLERCGASATPTSPHLALRSVLQEDRPPPARLMADYMRALLSDGGVLLGSQVLIIRLNTGETHWFPIQRWPRTSAAPPTQAHLTLIAYLLQYKESSAQINAWSQTGSGIPYVRVFSAPQTRGSPDVAPSCSERVTRSYAAHGNGCSAFRNRWILHLRGAVRAVPLGPLAAIFVISPLRFGEFHSKSRHIRSALCMSRRAASLCTPIGVLSGRQAANGPIPI